MDEQKLRRVVGDMAYEAFPDQTTTTNPRPPPVAELENLYLEAYYGTEHWHELRGLHAETRWAGDTFDATRADLLNQQLTSEFARH